MEKVTSVFCGRCSNSCMLEVTTDGEKVIKVTGAKCPSGSAIIQNPANRRDSIVYATAFVKNGRVSVTEIKTSKAVSGLRVKEIEKAMSELELEAPLKFGQVIAENFLDSGANVVACENVAKSLKA